MVTFIRTCVKWLVLAFVILFSFKSEQSVADVGVTVEREVETLFTNSSHSSRRGRDYDHGGYHVKCKHSNTGLFSFFAIPILLGNVMITFMGMIGITINITVNNTAVNNTNTNNNTNNNNNNNNNGGTGTSTSTSTGTGGNNNNNNNNNGKKKRDVLEGSATNLFGIPEFEESSIFKDLSDPVKVSKNFIASFRNGLAKSLHPSLGGVGQPFGRQAQVYDDVAIEFIEAVHQKYQKLMDQCTSGEVEDREDCNMFMKIEENIAEKFLSELDKNLV